MSLGESLNDLVSAYMTPSYVKVPSDETVTQAAKDMQKAGATEAIVVRDDVPLGIVTERDILYKVVAAGANPSSMRVKDIMTSPVETVEESSKVGEAIAKMSKLGVRRLGVARNGKLVGMVTQKAMVAGDLSGHVALPELASPSRFTCPYCDAELKSGEELSKHIDQVHLGPGLLEGNRTKW
ncbi:MAG: CBS domain-containing protein [Thaumarchaeota archaeon]|nr:CBS domain-containing protein [Nitrososphaerota archaeon]